MHKHNLYKTELINSQVRTSVLIDFQKADLYVSVKLFDVVRIFLLNMSFEGILFLTMFLSRTPKISLLCSDRPEKPSKFSQIEELLTETSVTLIWTPGFNGGDTQTFIIAYKSDTFSEWKNINVTDTGDTVMNLTIKELLSNTNYEFQIVATNSEGSSRKVTLQIKTKGIEFRLTICNIITKTPTCHSIRYDFCLIKL